MSARLKKLKEQLGNDFGKTIRWELACKEHHATTTAEKTRLAGQVLAEPATRTVAEWYSCWARLYGLTNPRLQQLVEQLNMAKLLHFQRLCKEQKADTDAEQIKIAEEVLSWGPLDNAGASNSAWLRLHGAKTVKAPPYKPTGY
jgi:hypothetical protein